MTEKKSLKASLLGIGASSLTFLGIGCGSGVCAAACGAAALTPFASLLGISTASMSIWSDNLLPLMTAISAVAFSFAYFSLYRKRETDCCDQADSSITSQNKMPMKKAIFWVSLVLTLAFYTNAIADRIVLNTTDQQVHSSASSLEGSTTSCKSSAISQGSGASCSSSALTTDLKSGACSADGD